VQKTEHISSRAIALDYIAFNTTQIVNAAGYYKTHIVELVNPRTIQNNNLGAPV
jgi:hypothetical protein